MEAWPRGRTRGFRGLVGGGEPSDDQGVAGGQRDRSRGSALRDSGWWLVAVGVAFTGAQLLFVSPRMGLSWDEAVYVSQVSSHAPPRGSTRRGLGGCRYLSRQ